MTGSQEERKECETGESGVKERQGSDGRETGEGAAKRQEWETEQVC